MCDSYVSWYTEVPDFTQCFQQIIFSLVPSSLFIAGAFINVWRVRKLSTGVRLPWTLLSISKIVMSIILIVISIAKVSLAAYQIYMHTSIPDVELYANCFRTVTYLIVLWMLILNKSCGVKSSTFLTIFWLIFSLCGAVIHRSILLKSFGEEYAIGKSLTYYILDVVHYPLIYCQFFLSLFPDETGKKVEKDSIQDASFFSRFSFHWFNQYIFKGAKGLLAVEDFADIPKEFKAEFVWAKFLKKWCPKLNESDIIDPNPSIKVKNASRLHLTCSVLKAFWKFLTISYLLRVVNSISIFIPSLILDQLITFMSTDEFLWKGIFFSIILVAADFSSRICHTFSMFTSELFSLQLKSALTSAIYRKSLRLSSSARQGYTSGEMVNLMSVDVEKIRFFAFFSSFLIGSPIKITLTLVLLWAYLGPSCLAGIVILIIMLALNTVAMNKSSSIQERQMETKDHRLKFITEVLNGIKVLKLYAWEIPFMKKITETRSIEVHLIKIFQFCYAAGCFVWGCAPFLVAVSCFVTYVMVDEKNILDPNTVFVSLNLMNILRFSVMELPYLTAEFIQVLVSLKRITDLLSAEECSDSLVGSNPDSGEAVTIRQGTFSWDLNLDPTLKEIDFHVPKGSFIAIIGPVGSGKSSLLSAFFGEMCKVAGSVDVKGSFAHVPQQAWVLNRTVKENILFVKPMDKRKYNAVLESCCLKADLEILPGGDNTEIGEKGVNLSGGQKHRVSLARAVYHDADIYVLDDPLSAVDAHVGKSIFENVIGPKGLLKNKTRILVTHNISVLNEADCIYTMRDGRIEEKGTYDELMKHGKLFAELIQEYANVKNRYEEIDDGIDVAVSQSLSESLDNVSPQLLIERSVSIQSLRQRTTSIDQKQRTTSVGSRQRSTSESSVGNKNALLVEEEKMAVGEVKREAFINYGRNMSFTILLLCMFGYLSHEALQIGGNFWLTAWSSDPVLPDGTQDIALRNKRIGIYAVFGFLQSVAIVFGSMCLAVGAARASKLFHVHMLDSVMKSPMSFFETTPLGRIVNRFGRDIDDIDTEIPMHLDGCFSCLFSCIGTFIVIGTSTPIFFAFLIPIMVVYYIVQKLYLMTSRQLKRLQSVTRSPIYSHFTETVQGTASIKAYKVQKQFILKAEEKLDINICCHFYVAVCNRWLEFRLSIIGDFLIFLAAILAVLSRGSLAAAVAGLSLTYAVSVNDALNWLVRTGTELENKSVSVERVEEYSQLPPEAQWVISESYPPKSWPSHGEIEFKNYSTRYREGLDLVLKSINVKISEGEKVGIVGRTGAGKSSFTLALFRIIEPAGGKIDIDDVDVAQIGLHQLRSKLTIIPQDPTLFTGRLRMNLDPNDCHTDSEVWSSLEQANLKGFVISLPDGLEHEISEGGGNLSVGQRQLVCLARALLKKTKILILDEATAAVDVETDSLIQNTIRTEFKENTVITIAHRLNTILDYDRVLVMESGEIAETGSPSELLQNPESHFYKMAKDAGLV